MIKIMNKEKKNIIINEVLNLLNYTDWEQLNDSQLRKKYDLKDHSELKAIYKWLANNYYIETYNSSYKLLKLCDSGLEVQDYGGWLEYLKQQSDTNEYLIEKERLEFENLRLQKESLEHSKTIRDQVDRIRNLEEQIKLISLIKLYWWLIPAFITVGVILSRIWDLVTP